MQHQEVERRVGILRDNTVNLDGAGQHSGQRLARAVEAQPFVAPHRLAL